MKHVPVAAGKARRPLRFCKTTWRWLLLTVCFLPLLTVGSGSLAAPGDAGAAKPKTPAAPVHVAVSSQKDMPIALQAIGTVEPFARVSIKSQVAGVLGKVNFREGDPVQAGDLLFSIDSRPYQARHNQALATLAKDQAELDNARKQAARYLPAAEKGYVSAEQADQMQTSVNTLEATIQADEAAVENARLDLDYCSIRAPISGVTGELLADPGNLVKALADDPLVTINQVTPIKVSFTLSEQLLPEVKKHLAAGQTEVTAAPSGHNGEPLTGRISFLDNRVDTASGTIRLKAIFANPGQTLWPGQFVQVHLRLAVRKGAVVVPSRAVQTSQSGNFVYVVKPDETVELRPVTPGFSVDEETVIENGLAAGETVVTDGQLRLAPGVKVKPVEAQNESGKAEAAK